MDDLIFRSALTGLFRGEHYLYSWEEIDEFVESLPTIDPESLRAQGKWENAECLVGKNEWQVCSVCSAFVPFPRWRLENWSYCPSCGAKMEV